MAPSANIPNLSMSDGPNGVRGTQFFDGRYNSYAGDTLGVG